MPNRIFSLFLGVFRQLFGKYPRENALIWTGSTLVFALLLGLGIGAKRLEYPYFLQAPVLCMGLTALAMLVLHRWTEWATPLKWKLSVHLLAWGSVASILCLFAGTDWGMGGLKADAWFNQSLVQQYSRSWSSQDFTYAGLSSFYPYGWHFLLAKTGRLLGLEPLLMWKLGTLVVAWLLPIGLFHIWRRLLRDATAAFLLVAGLILVLWQSELLLYKTYEALVLCLILPWYVLFVERIPAKRNWKRLLLGALSGAMLLCTYYYYFLLLVLVFALGKADLWRKKGIKAAGALMGRQIELALGVLLFSLPFWGPLAVDMLAGPVESLHTHWLMEHHLRVDTWLTLGVGASLLAFALMQKERPWARFLLRLALALLIFVLLGQVGIFIGRPLLFHKMNVFWLLLPAFLLPLLYLQVKDGHGGKVWAGKLSLPAMVVGALLTFGAVLPMQQLTDNEFYGDSFEVELNDNWADPAFQDLLRDRVVLTPEFNLNAVAPVYLFAGPSAHFMHPCSEYRDRLRFLALLQNYPDERFLAWILHHNRFDAVDYLYLPDTSLFLFGEDNFPDKKPALEVAIPFPEKAIQSKGWFFPDHGGFEGLYRVDPAPFEWIADFDRVQKCLIMLYGNEKARDWLMQEDGEAFKAMQYYETLLPQKLKDYTAKMDLFWMIYMAKDPVKPEKVIAREDDWTLYLDPPFLTYRKEHFEEADRAHRVYLHVFPKELWTLPDPNARPFFSLDFNWDPASELLIDGTAWYRIRLPEASVARIETGQFYETTSPKRYRNIWGVDVKP